MTPEELAKSVNNRVESHVTDDEKTALASFSVIEMRRFIHSLYFFNKRNHFEIAKVTLQARISEDASDSAKKLERYTRWLIALTLALVGLTIFLCADAYFSHHDIAHEGQAIHSNSK